MPPKKAKAKTPKAIIKELEESLAHITAEKATHDLELMSTNHRLVGTIETLQTLVFQLRGERDSQHDAAEKELRMELASTRAEMATLRIEASHARQHAAAVQELERERVTLLRQVTEAVASREAAAQRNAAETHELKMTVTHLKGRLETVFGDTLRKAVAEEKKRLEAALDKEAAAALKDVGHLRVENSKLARQVAQLARVAEDREKDASAARQQQVEAESQASDLARKHSMQGSFYADAEAGLRREMAALQHELKQARAQRASAETRVHSLLAENSALRRRLGVAPTEAGEEMDFLRNTLPVVFETSVAAAAAESANTVAGAGGWPMRLHGSGGRSPPQSSSVPELSAALQMASVVASSSSSSFSSSSSSSSSAGFRKPRSAAPGALGESEGKEGGREGKEGDEEEDMAAIATAMDDAALDAAEAAALSSPQERRGPSPHDHRPGSARRPTSAAARGSVVASANAARSGSPVVGLGEGGLPLPSLPPSPSSPAPATLDAASAGRLSPAQRSVLLASTSSSSLPPSVAVVAAPVAWESPAPAPAPAPAPRPTASASSSSTRRPASAAGARDVIDVDDVYGAVGPRSGPSSFQRPSSAHPRAESASASPLRPQSASVAASRTPTTLGGGFALSSAAAAVHTSPYLASPPPPPAVPPPSRLSHAGATHDEALAAARPLSGGGGGGGGVGGGWRVTPSPATSSRPSSASPDGIVRSPYGAGLRPGSHTLRSLAVGPASAGTGGGGSSSSSSSSRPGSASGGFRPGSATKPGGAVPTFGGAVTVMPWSPAKGY
jgi:hypothetical protein